MDELDKDICIKAIDSALDTLKQLSSMWSPLLDSKIQLYIDSNIGGLKIAKTIIEEAK